MLVIITGSETICKKLIAHQVLAKLNTYTSDGYTLDLALDPFKIYKDGELVTNLGDELYLGVSEEEFPARKEIFNRIMQTEVAFRETKARNHFFDKYTSLVYDLITTGVIEDTRGTAPQIPWLPEHDPEGDRIHYDSDYDDIVNAYNQSTQNYYVITGVFGKAFIDKIKNDLGSENVLVYNITRNPSVAFTLHKRIPNFTNAQVDMTDEEHRQKLYESIYASAVLKQDDSITTIKFEDMISSGSFLVNGTDVGIYLDYDAVNSYLTRYELESIFPNVSTTEEELAAFNASIQPCSLTTVSVDNAPADEEFNDPWNLFEKLGYAPLTIAEISAS